MTAGWCSRTVRAAVFAAVCVLLAALGHVLMSGADVPAWALAAGVTGTGAVGWGLAGRERGLPLIVTVVVMVQTLLHEAFSLAQESSDEPAHMHMHMHMRTGSMHMDSLDMGGTSMGHMGHAMDGGGVGSSSYGMLAAHLLAALLTGLWLAYGEKAAFRILRAVAGWLAAPLRLLLALPTPADRPRVRRGRPRSDRAPALRLLVHAITSRGPPVGPAVG
ncbi:hypothetical protein OG866_02395 [Streptomyces sp. NBC_00663]|uniref:hypothetical protein n=1 Tax=Streptomyces sp. NBC_00663 TaxID=2975801 RepID=UPI002E31349C|nr:hypothetical protein [Streptomyces sp. NBC_00663]